MEQTRRDSFRSRWGFKLACIGSAVGMGNIWLFPSRMSAYGGATFLIPYVIFVVLIASTGVIGEMAFGRAASGGPVAAFGTAAERRTGFQLESKEFALSVLEKVRMIKFAESLGGVETLITYPTTQTHADVPKEIRERNGITE